MPQKHIPGQPFGPENSVVPDKITARDRLITDAEELYGTELDATDREILATSPKDLVECMKQSRPRFTCQRVLQAYTKAACIAQRSHNVLTEVLFVQAMEEAKQKDKERAAGQTCNGPFWGLPSSFKDTYNIVGVDTSLGCSPHCNQPTLDLEREGGLVKLFRKGGGIPFCKTNIPQTLLAFECANPVFGPSSNPFDESRVPGGSSGGEAALIALRGTPVGWGSDIGGSLRIPAHYSGICGLKPVRGRWPLGRGRNPVPGFEGIKSSVGPMARNVKDLTWASQAITELTLSEQSRGDFVAPPIPWRNEALPDKLRVGWFTEFGGVRTSPACKRAVNLVVDKLKQAGHAVEEFTFPDPAEVFEVFVALTSADGYETLLGNLGKDPMEPSMRLVTLGSRIPSLLKNLAVWAVRSVLGDEVFASAFEASGKKSVKDFLAWTDRRDEFTANFNREAWGVRNFDMIVCPVQATPALRHGATEFLSPLANATIAFNVCDSTVGVLPVTRVDRTEDAWSTSALEPHHPPVSHLLEKRVYGDKGVYDANAMHGLPVGVQVVGRAYEEEKVLKMMQVVEDLVQYNREP